MDDELAELRELVKEKKERERIALEKAQLKAELESGTVKGSIKKGFKNILRGL